ncbi:SRPBCC family protein [Planococcus sp. CPCC 101016]|uniref:SRPBCC family protein n=1 Tax=Planococcus sp. CPCC 101016 TaxID=2599617 RepID=UPI0011B3DB3E|nr:SRPBCC family protein [Planococcus sp. CPCC 101016]TWT07942.1 SRPBCC family protein [Planococcus sp. CPCC 101016]
MTEWNERRIIAAPIEKVWALFSDEQLQSIMPGLEQHELVEGPPNHVGSKYIQRNRFGNRLVSYVMEITAYEDQPERKQKDIGFVAAGLFRITLSFGLTKLDDRQTLFVYSGSNTGVNLLGRTLLKIDPQNSSRQEAEELMARVAKSAEEGS